MGQNNEDRDEYLNDLSEEYGADPYIVHALADVLGEDEDYDGLLSMLEDFSGIM